MSAAPKIRLVIDSVRVTGLGARDARRLLDAVERELKALAPEIAAAARQRPATPDRARVEGGKVASSRRIETAAAPLARSIVNAVLQSSRSGAGR